jgi:hypothetical protein
MSFYCDILLLSLFNFIKRYIKRKDTVTIVRYANNLTLLEKQKEVLENEIKNNF